MVPTRLTLRNFLCYGEDAPTLELEGIGLACLSGQNGHGKSALIDALTWALWGKARGKSADQLIHLGRDDMRVDFEFLAGSARYRVVRRRQRLAGRGSSRPNLQFYVQGPLGWQPASGSTVAETERLIEQTVKLSYETFSNSALLLQGKSDLFTAAGPSDRKRVLAEILGLGRYDMLEAAARERRRAAVHNAALLCNALEEIAPRVAQLPTLEREQAAISAERARRLPERETLAAEVGRLRATADALERERLSLAAAEVEQVHEQQNVQSLEQGIVALAACIARDARVSAAEQAIRDGMDRLKQARATAQRLTEAAFAHQAVESRLVPLRQRLTRARAELETRVEATQREINRFRALCAERPALELELPRLEAEGATDMERVRGVEPLRQQEQELREQIALLRDENSRLRETGTEKRARLDDLRAAEQEGALDCPLCRTRLGLDGLHQIEALWQGELDEDRTRFAENKRQIDDLLGEAERHARAAGSLRDDAEHTRRTQDVRLGELRQRLEQARNAERETASLRATLDALVAPLATGSYAQDTRDEVERLSRERDALGYSAEAHQAALERARALEHYEGRRRALEQAQARLDANRQALAREEAQLTAGRLRLDRLNERVASLRAAIRAHPEVANRLREDEVCLGGLDTLLAGPGERLGGVQAQIEDCRALHRQQMEKAARLEHERDEAAIYEELSAAFGKKGVQALIIDTVLPEVESEANRLLAGMSDGRMMISLDTQRAKRDGDLAESLDVRISDEWGVRDYEMYSGGEAFRIDLALRIALAKLLARRAGAPLPTLIIDEGFGSQDAAGQERLIEAVTAIRDDFACVLIVTHIDALKQLFETRIEVEKGPTGSRAWISHA